MDAVPKGALRERDGVEDDEEKSDDAQRVPEGYNFRDLLLACSVILVR